MTYSCGGVAHPDAGLEIAQATKYELICRKLGLRPGMRLLDVGCGWGGMAIHAAHHHGVHAVGVTLGAASGMGAAAPCTTRASTTGSRSAQDYRDVHDGPFDAVSPIGMFEHVGAAKPRRVLRCAVPPGEAGWPAAQPRIAQSAGAHGRTRFARRGFVDRYVFPDGELHEVGSVVSRIQKAGFEARHVEGLREHYALTLREWVRNLEAAWPRAVAEVGEGRARVWRLYMAASAVGFEDGMLQIHQVLAVRTEKGASGMSLRPDFEPGRVANYRPTAAAPVT
jgi:cyclopropane-fatty-acyl-phospholipid synthase